MMSYNPEFLQTQLASFESPRRWWVALSGGLDSTVLLHSLMQTRPPEPVSVLHINHQLSTDADAWEAHCVALCRQLDVPLRVERVEVAARGRGLEDAAREARYGIFEECIDEGEVLLAGHHADDQVETLLLRLMRGSGPRGLSAMGSQRPLGRGVLARPLLKVSREALQHYASAQGLGWVEDESNRELHFDRNYLRQKVIPLLTERWPEMPRRWQISADLCAESETLLEDLAQQDLVAAWPRAEWGGWSLDLGVLCGLRVSRRHNLLRYWLRELGVAAISGRQLAEVDRQLLEGRADASARVDWAHWSLRRFAGRFYLLQQELFQQQECLQQGDETRAFGRGFVDRLPLEEEAGDWRTALPQGGELSLKHVPAGADEPLLSAELKDLNVRCRLGGERCRPSGRAHSQTLKRLLQEASLEPWWRERLPLLYSGETLVAVGDLWVCEGFAAGPDEPGLRVRWRRTGTGPDLVKTSFD